MIDRSLLRIIQDVTIAAARASSECWMALALRNETAYDGLKSWLSQSRRKRMTVLAHASPIWDDDDELIGAVNV